VTALVLAVTEDARVTSYRRRKRLLREQVRRSATTPPPCSRLTRSLARSACR
jgi:hypothetical protein